VDPTRLGRLVGRLTPEEMKEVDAAMRRVLALDLPW
jgi:mRNA-degrading endonuclease toxin of MazEF toxin-antitoxin module